jgi:hypothetical protein
LTVILKQSEEGICYGIFSLRRVSTVYPCEPSVTGIIFQSKDNYLVHLIGRVKNAGFRSNISVAGYGVKEVMRSISSPVMILLQYDVKTSN